MSAESFALNLPVLCGKLPVERWLLQTDVFRSLQVHGSIRPLHRDFAGALKPLLASQSSLERPSTPQSPPSALRLFDQNLASGQ